MTIRVVFNFFKSMNFVKWLMPWWLIENGWAVPKVSDSFSMEDFNSIRLHSCFFKYTVVLSVCLNYRPERYL